MPEGDSPTIARRRVRLALREFRDAAEMTQQQVADAMDWSLSKVIRIENGEVSIAPNDLRPLLNHLKVKDRSRVAELMQDAKIARTRQRRAWHLAPEYRDTLTPGLRRLIEYEAEAVAIHSYSVYHFPGLLQLPEYSAALIHTWDEEISPEKVRFRLEARRKRREQILGRLGTIRMTALLDESVFRRPIGGDGVLVKQLREMLHLGEQGLVAVRMAPFDIDTALSYNALFDILFLDADGELSSAVMYRESGLSDEIVEDLNNVTRHYERYQKLWDASLNEADTKAFIQQRLDTLIIARASVGPSTERGTNDDA